MRFSALILTLSALASVFSTSHAEEVAFVLAGDSTTYLDGGWGPGFCDDLVQGTPCVITAFSGETTESFLADGRWNQTLDNLRTQLSAGRRTFVTMQFGHNDQKIAPPETMGQNLFQFVQDIRAVESDVGKGIAEPVLVTSLTRRNFFSNGTIDDILGPWADVTILVAQNTSSNYIDLHAESIKYVVAIGATASHRLNLASNDNTHLNENGTIVFGRMMADLFVETYPELDLPVIPDPALSYNISHGIPSF